MGSFRINRCKLCYNSAEVELFGVEKLDQVSLFDFRHASEKCETYATEHITLAVDEYVNPD
jgi:hypothetical protein